MSRASVWFQSSTSAIIVFQKDTYAAHFLSLWNIVTSWEERKKTLVTFFWADPLASQVRRFSRQAFAIRQVPGFHRTTPPAQDVFVADKRLLGAMTRLPNAVSNSKPGKKRNTRLEKKKKET